MQNLKIRLSIFLLILITSCSKDDGDSDSGIDSSNTVFVVGREAKGDFLVPVIWKNGEKSFLPAIADTDIDDLKVAVENNDLYVVGVETNSNNKMSIVLWKNGVQSRFSEAANFVEIKQIIVDNGSVYVLGEERLAGGEDKYRYWKNGTATTIINSSVTVDDDFEQNDVSKMVVVNNDVYCIGFEWNASGTILTGKYWKNAIPTAVSVFKDKIFDFLQDIQVNGNEVSILFNQLNTATFAQETKLWKNNVVSVLGSGSSDFFAAGMVIKEGVEHVLIEEKISDTKTKLLYLKDRVKTEITDGSSEVTRSFLNVDGSNVCVAYYTDFIFTYTTKYWLNGTTKTLNGFDKEPFDAFFLSGTDVYMTSSESNKPQFWVNGTQTELPFDASKNFTVANDVFVTK
ncbi:hypothetical protein [Flavobacterium sp.]|uniref:hypothetical protein n=1 Tax=Flavobacterium sp. TaxID=239 RepID=UPI0032668733